MRSGCSNSCLLPSPLPPPRSPLGHQGFSQEVPLIRTFWRRSCAELQHWLTGELSSRSFSGQRESSTPGAQQPRKVAWQISQRHEQSSLLPAKPGLVALQ